jgi:hypothetical protein
MRESVVRCAHGAWSNLVIVGNRGTRTTRDKRQERTSVRGKRVSLLVGVGRKIRWCNERGEEQDAR